MDPPEEDGYDSDGNEIGEAVQDVSLLIAESFPYQEFMFVITTLMDYVHGCCQEIMQRVCKEERYLAMCRAKRGNSIGQRAGVFEDIGA